MTGDSGFGATVFCDFSIRTSENLLLAPIWAEREKAIPLPAAWEEMAVILAATG